MAHLSEALAKHTGYAVVQPAFSHFLYFFSDEPSSSSSVISTAFFFACRPELLKGRVSGESSKLLLFFDRPRDAAIVLKKPQSASQEASAAWGCTGRPDPHCQLQQLGRRRRFRPYHAVTRSGRSPQVQGAGGSRCSPRLANVRHCANSAAAKGGAYAFWAEPLRRGGA